MNDELKKLKKGSLSFIICTLNPNFTEIIVEKTGTETDWDDFQTKLPETEVRIHG